MTLTSFFFLIVISIRSNGMKDFFVNFKNSDESY